MALENERPQWWRATSYDADLPVGAPAVLFSDTDGFLLAWRRYLDHPGMWRSWLLKHRLPDEVTLLPNGCLYLGGQSFGMNVNRSLKMWLEQFSAKEIA